MFRTSSIPNVAPMVGIALDEVWREMGRQFYTNALTHLEETLLARQKFVAGDELSITDLSAYMELGPMR